MFVPSPSKCAVFLFELRGLADDRSCLHHFVLLGSSMLHAFSRNMSTTQIYSRETNGRVPNTATLQCAKTPFAMQSERVNLTCRLALRPTGRESFSARVSRSDTKNVPETRATTSQSTATPFASHTGLFCDVISTKRGWGRWGVPQDKHRKWRTPSQCGSSWNYMGSQRTGGGGGAEVWWVGTKVPDGKTPAFSEPGSLLVCKVMWEQPPSYQTVLGTGQRSRYSLCFEHLRGLESRRGLLRRELFSEAVIYGRVHEKKSHTRLREVNAESVRLTIYTRISTESLDNWNGLVLNLVSRRLAPDRRTTLEHREDFAGENGLTARERTEQRQIPPGVPHEEIQQALGSPLLKASYLTTTHGVKVIAAEEMAVQDLEKDYDWEHNNCIRSTTRIKCNSRKGQLRNRICSRTGISVISLLCQLGRGRGRVAFDFRDGRKAGNTKPDLVTATGHLCKATTTLSVVRNCCCLNFRSRVASILTPRVRRRRRNPTQLQERSYGHSLNRFTILKSRPPMAQSVGAPPVWSVGGSGFESQTIDSELQCQTVSPDLVIVGLSSFVPTMEIINDLQFSVLPHPFLLKSGLMDLMASLISSLVVLYWPSPTARSLRSTSPLQGHLIVINPTAENHPTKILLA
ncbi:hypothetical protein PR048_030206 [Dryococelus australis]|uniref:Uncharacterized protein n=1 Tax=Dryococelus australis TaxID=614101 RepID=A0ABQ9G927_9NEOP|nr:hypothetical protein PR048_030206 [Dryococelus australis]